MVTKYIEAFFSHQELELWNNLILVPGWKRIPWHRDKCMSHNAENQVVYKLPRDCDRTTNSTSPNPTPLPSDCTSYSYNIQKITWFELAPMSCIKVCVCAWGSGCFKSNRQSQIRTKNLKQVTQINFLKNSLNNLDSQLKFKISASKWS